MRSSITAALILLAVLLSSASTSAEANRKHIYLCRSPLLAFDFWREIHAIQSKGVTMTPKIAQEICAGMKAGKEPQCIHVEGDEFKPIASGWGGALALTDGKTKVWFHNPEGGGWVHPDYYVAFVNQK